MILSYAAEPDYLLLLGLFETFAITHPALASYWWLERRRVTIYNDFERTNWNIRWEK